MSEEEMVKTIVQQVAEQVKRPSRPLVSIQLFVSILIGLGALFTGLKVWALMPERMEQTTSELRERKAYDMAQDIRISTLERSAYQTEFKLGSIQDSMKKQEGLLEMISRRTK